jgi:hypothetical protein
VRARIAAVSGESSGSGLGRSIARFKRVPTLSSGCRVRLSLSRRLTVKYFLSSILVSRRLPVKFFSFFDFRFSSLAGQVLFISSISGCRRLQVKCFVFFDFDDDDLNES